MSVKELVDEINDEILKTIHAIESQQLEVGDKVIIYSVPKFNRCLDMTSDTVKSVTKTGIISLINSDYRFKNGRLFGDYYSSLRIIKCDKDIVAKYNKGVLLKKAEVVIRDKLHLMPVDSILLLAEKLQQIETDNKAKNE